MYSILPALTALMFLFYGFYVVSSRGISRVSTSFLILCVTTFFWQFTWAILFQVTDSHLADQLIKLGWLLILFLPTSLYHFLVEITGKVTELRFVYLSYFISLLLSATLVTTDLFLSGYYEYFWGFYPKAGVLHPIHVLQTAIVVGRGLLITYRKQSIVQSEEKLKLRYCIAGLLIYLLASMDYLCNYGLEVYPLGVIFIVVSLGLISIATTRYHLMDNARLMAASIAHEMRTPLATVKLQAQTLNDTLPVLIEGYQRAVAQGLMEDSLSADKMDYLISISAKISDEINASNEAIDMMLALASENYLNEKEFKIFSVKECVESAVSKYPYRCDNEKVITVDVDSDFVIMGSDVFLTYVIFNLIKNSLDAIREVANGKIDIYLDKQKILIKDNGVGISSDVLPHIFDSFFTTKYKSVNAGVGLAFCKRVMKSFGGEIYCESLQGSGSTFILSFNGSAEEETGTLAHA